MDDRISYIPVFFGAAGTAATFAFLNTALGCVAGVLTILLLLGKLHKEWTKRKEWLKK